MNDPESTNQFIKSVSDIVRAFSDSSAVIYLWMLLMGIWGGTVNYLRRIKAKKLPFSISELLGEWVISSFCGICTGLILRSSGKAIDPLMIYASAGIAGHMGGKGIAMLEEWWTSRWTAARPPRDPQ